jgi:adenylate cyclase
MQLPIYNNYLESINNVLKTGKRRGLQKAHLFENVDGGISGLNDSKPWQDIKGAEVNFNSLKNLSSITGKKAKYHEKLGAHPDFSHLKASNATEYHYITSMFIDVRNSTSLFKKYDPIAVANITGIIQQAAIHTCWYFDGYVQRLHGDGLLVYFGGKNTTLSQSINNAVNAAGFISYFVKNDLKKLFLEQGIEDIYTRIGIDTGDKDAVLWHTAGMGECSEITTCSIHTSLAFKMQSNAGNNGVIVGDNVKNSTTVNKDLYTYKKYKHDGKESTYIFQIEDESFNYSQHEFDWEKYLRTHPQITVGEKGTLYLKDAAVTPNVNVAKNLDYLKSNTQGYKPYMK